MSALLCLATLPVCLILSSSLAARGPLVAVRQASAGVAGGRSVWRSAVPTRGLPQRGVHRHHRNYDRHHDDSDGPGFEGRLSRQH